MCWTFLINTGANNNDFSTWLKDPTSAAAEAIDQSRFGISRHLKQNLCHSFRHTGHTVRFSQICFTIKYFVCLFELGLYYFKAVFKLRTYTPHIHKLYFSILLCLDLNILLCLDFSILLCLDFSILLCLDFSILLCLDFKKSLLNIKPYA